MENQEEKYPNKVEGLRQGFLAAFIILLIACSIFLVATAVYMSLYYGQDNSKTNITPNISSNIPSTPNTPSTPNIPSPSIDSLEGKYAKGAVAADNVMCSEIGRNVLLRGGNAVEAAIAALFCIGIMDTHSAGMGGGHIMTIYNATEKKCYVVDARHAAPLAANATMFGNNATPSEYGWRSVLIPGEIAGLWKEYTQFKSGKVTWKSLVQPTVDLLADGYPVTHALQAAFDQYHDYLLGQPTMKWAFNPNSPNGNQTWKVGELITTRQNFKNFTQLIADAENGSKYGSNPHQVFYNSSWTQKMADEFATFGGIITLKDFQLYEAKLRSQDEVIYSYHKNGRIICGAPPPASSAVVQSILGILDGYDYPQNATFDQEVENFHRFIEASKFAFAARLNLGDIDFVKNALSISKEIVTANWTSAMRAKITNTTHDDPYYNGTQNFYMPDIRGTTHISVLDAEGNAVSVTSTINLFFGAKVTSDSTGVLWNDEMNDFSLPGLSDYFGFVPSPANYIEPRKRPMSATSPIVIYNEHGNVEDINEISIFGAAGGSTIISATAGIAWHNLWLNDSVKAAMDFPRLHNQYRPNNTNYEDRLPEEYANALRARGHNMTSTDEIATATAINKPASKSPNYSSRYSIFANSDFRKGVESGPAGY